MMEAKEACRILLNGDQELKVFSVLALQVSVKAIAKACIAPGGTGSKQTSYPDKIMVTNTRDLIVQLYHYLITLRCHDDVVSIRYRHEGSVLSKSRAYTNPETAPSRTPQTSTGEISTNHTRCSVGFNSLKRFSMEVAKTSILVYKVSFLNKNS